MLLCFSQVPQFEKRGVVRIFLQPFGGQIQRYLVVIRIDGLFDLPCDLLQALAALFLVAGGVEFFQQRPQLRRFGIDFFSFF